MKISLIKNAILKNKIIILLFVILISCDSMGDSNNGSMDEIMPDNPTMQPSPVNPIIPDPTSPPPVAPPVNPTPTPQPTNPPPVDPSPTPDPSLDYFQSLVLSLVNVARAQARNCGSEFSPSAPPVNWDERIESAALGHSQDMA